MLWNIELFFWIFMESLISSCKDPDPGDHLITDPSDPDPQHWYVGIRCVHWICTKQTRCMPIRFGFWDVSGPYLFFYWTHFIHLAGSKSSGTSHLHLNPGIAGQCRTNPYTGMMPMQDGRTVADSRPKCRCWTNFFSVFQHLFMLCQHHKVT